MLPGFPKCVRRTKLGRGRYLLEREDGVAEVVIRGCGRWLIAGCGRTARTLGIAEFDLRCGYTPRDQLAAAEDGT